MAKKTLTITIRVHWFDRYFYIPFLRALYLMGFKFDIDVALVSVKNRMKVVSP